MTRFKSCTMTCSPARCSVSARSFAPGLLTMLIAGLAGAQNVGPAFAGASATAPALASGNGPVESSGPWLQSRDARARELRSALKAQAPVADDPSLASRKLSAQEREAMRAQLREQGRDVLKPSANGRLGRP
jgi:hypothetical protein